MKVTNTDLDGVLVLEPARFTDERGYFSESWNRQTMMGAGIEIEWVQDNHSVSKEAGTVRGLHYQSPPNAQAKLVRCGQGALFDVVVDVRRGSVTYGKWIGVHLSAENGKQLLIPTGFLHGFVTRKPNTEVIYKCSDYYAPKCDGAVRWNSPDIGIDWGVADTDVILSDKDATAPLFSEFDTPFGDAG